MPTRFLNKNDAMAFKALRLFSLRESLFSFSDSYEDEQHKSIQDYSHDIEQYGSPLEKFVLATFNETNELVGFVKFKRDQRTKARHRCSLHSLYVSPPYRGKGLAKQLMNEALQIISTIQGIEQIQLSAIISSKNHVVPFYESFGFSILGGLIKDDLIINGEYVNAVYMVKHITT